MKTSKYTGWKLLAASLLSAFLIIEYYDWGIYEFTSITFTIFFLLLTLIKLGKSIPIKEFTIFIYFVQLLIGSMLTYKFYPNIKIGFMIVDEDTYYTFTYTYLIAFVLGLYFPKLKYSGFEFRELVMKRREPEEYSKLGIILIVIGFFAQGLSTFFPSPGLSFIYVLLSFFKFVGLYYLWIAKYKYRYLFLALIFIPLASQSLAGGLYIELFVWIFLSYATFQIRRPLSFKTNILAFVGGLFLVFLLQSVKVDFRKVAWKEEGKDLSLGERLSFLGNLVTTVNLGDQATRDKANIRFIVRINQGYINAFILRNMPARQDFVNGKYFFDELTGIFLPRFLAPEKAVVGDHAKFEKFAGWKLDKRVAMSVSILGDGYGNFGFVGGMIFCYLYGVFLNFLYHLIVKLAIKYEISIVLWIPMIFTYSMRCGDEFYIITNHIFKSSILIVAVFYIFKSSGFFLHKNRIEAQTTS